MKRIILICAAMLLMGANAFAAEEQAVREIPVGTSRAEIHGKIGTPDKSALCGYKEIYSLSNGYAAVLSYYDDMLFDGFIVIN